MPSRICCECIRDPFGCGENKTGSFWTYRLYMYWRLQNMPSSCQWDMNKQRITPTSKNVAADTSALTLSDLSESVSLSIEALRFSFIEAPRISSCWSNSNFVDGLSLSRECIDWRLPRRLCGCCWVKRLASAYLSVVDYRRVGGGKEPCKKKSGN